MKESRLWWGNFNYLEFKFTMNSYRRIIVGSPKNRIYCDEFFDQSVISIECACVTRLFYMSSVPTVTIKYPINVLSKTLTFSIQVQRNSKQKPHNHTIWCKNKCMKSRKKSFINPSQLLLSDNKEEENKNKHKNKSPSISMT